MLNYEFQGFRGGVDIYFRTFLPNSSIQNNLIHDKRNKFRQTISRI